ncbi:MAG: hypothetical protein JWN70_4968 [Planctomycetaceae bacterium]|nr:hypothetical protein [Planctomycetaceae bacterium]
MKTSRVVGVLVLAGIGIGAALSYLLPDLDFGLGAGGIGLPTGKTETKVVGIEASPLEETETKPEAEPVVPPTVVYVLIDGRDYLLRRGPEGKAAFKPATLDDVIEAAQTATGDDNGIRIRIAQKSSSRELTERALQAKLEEAGVPKDAIRWKDEPVD